MSFIFFTIISIALAIIGGVIYLLYLPFKIHLLRKGKLTKQSCKIINIVFALVLLLIATFLTFDAAFPDEQFYRNEFKAVTFRELPGSAVFIEKEASIPGIHGDYCSSAQIKLSKEDYGKLLAALNMDSRIRKDDTNYSFHEFSIALGSKKTDNIIYSFAREEGLKSDQKFRIHFYNDGETIFVNIISS